ncbi:arginase family protein [Naasia lichenicola]|uniref:Arginase family protein n=1 Tax=Naasia lichenicola TaxID=2565933 RepID=A0A4S4FNI4_9MICO|nr:arginase family protein [Naasia lichenicola]THG31788.1 arginase family protein [Naasia lichenicola]
MNAGAGRTGGRIALLSAPSGLGLRPPAQGREPGTSGAPDALRTAGLFTRFANAGAIDAGAVVPGRYVDDDETRPPGRLRNQDQIVEHARRLGHRIAHLLGEGRVPLVIGGDCSLLIGAGIGLSGIPGAGLVHIDGHTDFRHPGNSDSWASLAGEDLAAAIGRHIPAIADVDGLGPFFAADRTVHIGCRDDDDELAEVRRAIGLVLPASRVTRIGAAASADATRAVVGHGGYWLHLDVDALDPSFMPAVDSPDPGGLGPDELIELLQQLAPEAIGVQITVFDPELDPDGRYAALLTEVLVAGLGELGSGRAGHIAGVDQTAC